MIVVSARDFRSAQGKYFDLVNENEDVIIKSRKGNFRLVPVEDKIITTSEAKFLEDLKAALLEVKAHIDGKAKLKSLQQVLDEL